MARRAKSRTSPDANDPPRRIPVRRLDRDTEVSAPAEESHVEIRADDLELGGQQPETWGFKDAAELLVPSMLDLPARTKGDFTELAIDVAATVFPDKPDCVWEIELHLRGKIIDTRRFRNFTQRHQFIVPTSVLFEEQNSLRLSGRAIAGAKLAPRFFVRVFYMQKERLLDFIEENSVWVYSTARSGSSWLSQDILCHGQGVRSMDEPGIGRLFAPVDWVAERFYDLAHKDAYAQSGLDYETRAKARLNVGFIPPFERSFMFGGQENSIWSQQNYPLYLDLIRTTMFQHVLHEWGVIDYRTIVFKMPNDSHAADVVMQALPKAFMLLLMRDGRDVMKSRFSPFASPDLATTTDPALRLHAIAFYAHLWNFQVDIMQSAFVAHAPERKLLLHYEELRVTPTAQLRVMFDKIGMKISDAALDELVSRTRLENIPDAQKGPDKPRQTGQIGKYANVFSQAEIELMEAIMGRNLRRFGYAVAGLSNASDTPRGAAAFELSLADDSIGSGWYRAEGAGATAFRWTGPEQVSTIDMKLLPREYRVVISHERPLALSHESLVVTANGRDLPVEIRTTSALSRNAWFTIPADLIAATGGLLHLALDVGEVVRPSEHGGLDNRVLGIVIFRIAFEPVLDVVEPTPEPVQPVAAPPPEPTAPPVAAIPAPAVSAAAQAAVAPAAKRAPIDLPIIGEGDQVGEVEGVFVDRWVGPNLRLTIQPRWPLHRVTLHGWFHGETPADGEVRLRIGGQTVTQAMTTGMFVMSVVLPAETTDAIPMEMEATNWLLLEGPAGRKLVFVLQRIVLE